MNKLLWGRYDGSDGSKHILILEVGIENDKLIGIYTDYINEADAAILKQEQSLLETLTTGQKIEWIKTKCPSMMRGCRTLKTTRFNIIKTFTMNKSHGTDESII